MQPPRAYCGKLPEQVTVYWEDPNLVGGKTQRTVTLSPSLTQGFMKDPHRQLLVTVDETDQPHIYFRKKLSDVVTKYLEHGQNPQQVSQRLLYEKLWQAIDQQDLAQVKDLVAQGAPFSLERLQMDHYDSALPEHLGWGMLSLQRKVGVEALALSTGNEAIISYLLQSGGLTFQSGSEFSVLSSFIRFQNHGALSAYLAYGASPDGLYQEYSSYTPINHVQYLKQAFATVYYPAISLGGPVLYKERLLYLAAQQKDIKAVKLLMQYGAKVNFRTHHNQDFLQWAKTNTSAEVLALLLVRVNEIKSAK